METKINALVANEEFANKLKTAETMKQIIALFADEGVSVTVEDVNIYLEDQRDGDLSEDALDDVSGGSVIGIGFRIVTAILKSRNRRHGGGGHRF